MFSARTLLEILRYIDNLSHNEIDRLLTVFGISLPIESRCDYSKMQKSTEIYNQLVGKIENGPFSNNIHEDLLQYIYNDYIIKHNQRYLFSTSQPLASFKVFYPVLVNSLRKDGYELKDSKVQKILPKEFEEAKTESELNKLLKKNNFQTSHGHLKQATDNFVHGHWASANSQFRTFTESLFIEIVAKVLPNHSCSNANGAIQLLSKTASPPFLREELNEVVTSNNKYPFIESFWKRLHTQGSHPGLSDKEDCEFRYQLTMTMAYYLLKRLEAR